MLLAKICSIPGKGSTPLSTTHFILFTEIYLLLRFPEKLCEIKANWPSLIPDIGTSQWTMESPVEEQNRWFMEQIHYSFFSFFLLFSSFSFSVDFLPLFFCSCSRNCPYILFDSKLFSFLRICKLSSFSSFLLLVLVLLDIIVNISIIISISGSNSSRSISSRISSEIRCL